MTEEEKAIRCEEIIKFEISSIKNNKETKIDSTALNDLLLKEENIDIHYFQNFAYNNKESLKLKYKISITICVGYIKIKRE